MRYVSYQIRTVFTWYQPAEINTYVRYVPDTYVPGISRQKFIRTYVMFRPWTHTSDDSYIYQLSLFVSAPSVLPEDRIGRNTSNWC